MDQRRLQTVNGRGVQAPLAGTFALGNFGTRDPSIPNLPLGAAAGAFNAGDPQINFRCGSAVGWGTRTNTTITAPPTISDGDLLLLFWERQQNGVTTPGGMTAPTPPSGFTLYDPASEGPILWQTDGANIVGIFCYYKRASGESGSYTVTHGSTDCEAYLAVFENVVSSGSPFGAYGSRTASTSTTAGTAAGITHTERNSRLCYLMMDFAGAGGLSPPTPLVEHRDAGIYFATQWRAEADATGDRTQTTGNNTWATRMFELLVEPASTAISGTASITLDAATLSATGTLPIAGTASITLDAVTLSATGAVALTGALSATLGDVTLSAAGTLGSPISGEAAITLADATLVATGVVALAGVASITLDAATLAATGTLPIAGTASITLGAVALSATGTVALTGALSTTLGDVTLSATGTLGSSISGEAAITLADATLSATGAVALAGAASITLDDATLAATGTVALTASASITLGDATLAATGKVALAAALSTTLADATLSATGALALAGAASITLEDATLAATGVGAALNTGAASITLDDATLTATGTLTDGEAPPSTAIGGAWAWHRRALARRKAKAEPDPVVFVDIAGEILGEAIVRGRLEAVVYRDAPAAGYSVASAGPLETVVDIGGTVAARTEAPPATIIALQDRREWALTDDEIAALSLAA